MELSTENQNSRHQSLYQQAVAHACSCEQKIKNYATVLVKSKKDYRFNRCASVLVKSKMGYRSTRCATVLVKSKIDYGSTR